MQDWVDDCEMSDQIEMLVFLTDILFIIPASRLASVRIMEEDATCKSKYDCASLPAYHVIPNIIDMFSGILYVDIGRNI